ncbi:12369_t:CDS:10 [Ambispora gerdemannii]|uniref:Mediator of RNA polymerase II transcription subunit 1 n=1 Tax=Ambispora gerdemannii TaxID=144530 RepID=A0A9N8YMZ8_9GLOM|nr:12369_t:CDS:10 [Ambispora gerdemannii]
MSSNNTVLYFTQELTRLLKAAQEEWGVSAESTKENRASSEAKTFPQSLSVHPLGPVNMSQLAAEFSKNISMIREILKRFRDSLHNAASCGPQAESHIRKYIHNLREKAQITGILTDTQENLTICKGMILDACTDYMADSQLTMKQVEFDEISQQISKVRVNYGSETAQDPNVDNLLTAQLQSRNIKLFRKNFSALHKLDEFCKNYSENDFFFERIKSLSTDIFSIYERERVIVQDDTSRILTHGHGLPLNNMDKIGPSIAFWAPRYVILETNWELTVVKQILNQGQISVMHDSLKRFHRLWITMEESHVMNEFLPSNTSYLLVGDDIDENLKSRFDVIPDATCTNITSHITSEPSPPLKFICPKKDAIESAYVQFVAWLEPAVYVSDSVARTIGNLASIKSRGHIVSSMFDSSNMVEAISLEKLLIQDAVPNPTLATLSSSLSLEARWEMQIDESSPLQIYSFASQDQTYARKIDRIPFIHPVDLYEAIKLLRQQLTFNTIFQSIFNSTSYRPTSHFVHSEETMFGETIPSSINLKVMTQEPPKQMLLTLELPKQSSLSLQIVILTEDGQPYVVTLQGESAEYDRKMTQVLQMCQNVPMLVRWIWKSMMSSDVAADDGISSIVVKINEDDGEHQNGNESVAPLVIQMQDANIIETGDVQPFTLEELKDLS